MYKKEELQVNHTFSFLLFTKPEIISVSQFDLAPMQKRLPSLPGINISLKKCT